MGFFASVVGNFWVVAGPLLFIGDDKGGTASDSTPDVISLFGTLTPDKPLSRPAEVPWPQPQHRRNSLMFHSGLTGKRCGTSMSPCQYSWAESSRAERVLVRSRHSHCLHNVSVIVSRVYPFLDFPCWLRVGYSDMAPVSGHYRFVQSLCVFMWSTSLWVSDPWCVLSDSHCINPDHLGYVINFVLPVGMTPRVVPCRDCSSTNKCLGNLYIKHIISQAVPKFCPPFWTASRWYCALTQMRCVSFLPYAQGIASSYTSTCAYFWRGTCNTDVLLHTGPWLHRSKPLNRHYTMDPFTWGKYTEQSTHLGRSDTHIFLIHTLQLEHQWDPKTDAPVNAPAQHPLVVIFLWMIACMDSDWWLITIYRISGAQANIAVDCPQFPVSTLVFSGI